MNGQEKIETYLSSIRHDLRSQLMVVREGASMILDGIGDSNCETCFSLLKPALECTDELNKLIGELINASRFNAILTPSIPVKGEELGSVKKELLGKNEELRVIKNELLGKDEELGSVKKELLGKDEELKGIKKELLQKDEELKRIEREPKENELEILKYELMGMISHSIRTPLAVVKESLSLVLDEIPGKLSVKQRELLSNGKENADELIQSIEVIFQKSWDEIVHSARKHFPTEAISKKNRLMPKKRILIVEDQAIIINMLKMRLEANNYEVITASDGQEGFEKAHKENPNLIILDVMLPKMNGYKICQLLKSDPKYAKIPILISSGRTPQEVRKVGREVGADAYVSKPFEAEVLLSKIKELLEKSNGKKDG